MRNSQNSSSGKHKKRRLIRIRVSYLSGDLQRLTGKKEEIVSMPEGSRSGDFIDFFQERYPEILKKFGPGYLEFTLNREKPHVLTLLKEGDRYEFTTWTDEEILKHDLQQLEETGAMMELPKGKFKMPKWMECTWRRVPCGRDDCPICGRIKRDRQRHILRGEDPDDIKSVFEDVDQNFKEVLQIIKKDAESKGFDITNIENIQEPPEPEKFPLYRKVKKWNEAVRAIGDRAEIAGEFWIYTEAAVDLFWYANTLMARTYRQLCNRWHIENGDEYGEFDYQYTRRVLKETLKIFKKSLRELIKENIFQKKEFGSILSELLKLEKQIVKI